jgi:transmembrane sensor
MLDDHIESFRKRMQPRWDDLRERRLLRNVERRLQERHAKRWAIRRTFIVAVPVSFAIAALAIYVTGFGHDRKPAIATQAASSAPAMAATASAAIPPRSGFEIAESRVLADGSRLELSPTARVQIKGETSKRVEVAQSSGRVRYQVTAVPARAFVVMAAGVRVQVTGTVFVVGIEEDKVSVNVEKGWVRVVASSGEVQLGAGDELSTPADPAASNDARVEPPAALDGPPSPRSATRESASAPSASALLDRADAERRSGDMVSAAATLREFVTRHPNDRRAALGWFTLGKVERARDRAASGAKAFRKSFSLAPDGPLGEDALAEEAAAWAAANNTGEAQTAAERYLRRFPDGVHVTRMQHILE